MTDDTDSFGFRSTLDMLRTLDAATQKRLLADVGQKDPGLAARLSAHLFTFEDLKLVNPQGLAQIVEFVEDKVLALALRKASDELKQALFSQMSRRKAAMYEDLIVQIGPQPLAKVEEAQKRVVEVAQDLEKIGKIVLRKGEEDPLV